MTNVPEVLSRRRIRIPTKIHLVFVGHALRSVPHSGTNITWLIALPSRAFSQLARLLEHSTEDTHIRTVLHIPTSPHSNDDIQETSNIQHSAL